MSLCGFSSFSEVACAYFKKRSIRGHCGIFFYFFFFILSFKTLGKHLSEFCTLGISFALGGLYGFIYLFIFSFGFFRKKEATADTFYC